MQRTAARLLIRTYSTKSRFFCSGDRRAAQQERKRMLRERQMAEMEEMNQRFQRTSGKYNSLSYLLKVHLNKLIGTVVAAVLAYFAFKVSTTVGQTADIRDPSKKKFTIISQQYESKLSSHLLKLFLNYYEEQEPSFSQRRKISSLQTTMKPTLIESDQPILIVLPQSNYLISTSLLRSLAAEDLNKLTVVFQILFRQRFHILDLKLSEITTFWNYDSASSEIILRQIYTRPYSHEEISQTILLIKGMSPESFIEISKKVKQVSEGRISARAAPENLWLRIKDFTA